MKKEIKKIIITLVVIALIIGGFVFFKQKQVSDPNAVDTQEEAIKENPEVPNQETKTKDQSVTASFDKKMKEASTLFLKKDYQGAISLYTQALSIEKSEYAYAGLYSAELATKDYVSAEKALLLAIEQNPKNSDYWSWYLVLLEDAMDAPREKLDQVYNKALNSVLDNKKINIVTQYARVLENIGDYNGAITQWEKAVTLNPSMKDIYQKEIDTLKSKI